MCLLITASLIVGRATYCAQQGGAQTQGPDDNAGQYKAGSQTTNPAQRPAQQDNGPSLSSVRAYSPGSVGEERSFLLPAIQISSYLDTNPNGASDGTGTDILYRGSVSGSLALQRINRRSQFNLSYAGGEIMSSRPLTTYYGNNLGKFESFHSLTIDEQINGKRWKTDLMDQFSYLPESSFGFPGFNGLPGFAQGFGTGFNNVLNPSLVPNQSILTGNSRPISNVSAVEVDYSITPRSSISASGAYGLLHYFTSGFIDSNYYMTSIGYDRSLTPRDNMGLYYTYSDINFNGLYEDIAGHSVQIAYGRRITGKLALKLSGGPLVSVINQPTGGSVTNIFFSTFDSLQYLLHRGDIHLDYVRYISPGSGVLYGAETDQVTGGIGHQLGRRFKGSMDFGYAQNRALSGSGGVIPGSKFNTWQGGASLSRLLGRTMSFFVSYQFQRETANAPTCPGGQCEGAFLRHIASIGFSWRGRPIALH